MSSRRNGQKKSVQAPEERDKAKRSPRYLVAGVSAVVLLLAVVAGAFFLLRKKNTPVDVILVTIDTLRADAPGYAGNRAIKTPFLDQLASRGIVFDNAHAHNVVTLASHTNILTGLYPYEHGIRDNFGFTIDPKIPTIATMLHDRGYVTGAFVGAYPLDHRTGLNRGFDVYDDHYPAGDKWLTFNLTERPANQVLEPAVKWFDSQAGKKRFMWVHLYDPHDPYTPPEPFGKQYWEQPYYGEIAFVDSCLQKYLGPLLERNPDALVIVTGDHGEALGDHGELTHGLFTYESTLHIPLIVYDRNVLRHRVEHTPARHVDIVPTILSFIGFDKPAALPGQSLLAGDRQNLDTYFESLSANLNRGWAPLVGMIHTGKKYIDLPLPELYDLAHDPAEKKNIYDDDRRSVVAIRKLLVANAPAARDKNLSSEQQAQLLSLGYVSGNAAAKTNYGPQDDPKNLIALDRKMHEMMNLYRQGQFDRAIALVNEVVRERPDMQVMQDILQKMTATKGQVATTFESLREQVAGGQASAETRKRYGILLSNNRHYAEAVQVLEPLSSQNDPAILNAYGVALANLGRQQEAIRQFQRALQIDPKNAPAYQNLGVAALQGGAVVPARAYLLKAISLDPKLPVALNTLGVIYAQQGDDAHAIDSWTRAVAADPELYDALFNIGVVAGRSRRWTEARDALERFVRYAPPEQYGRDIAAAKQMLAQISRQAS